MTFVKIQLVVRRLHFHKTITYHHISDVDHKIPLSHRRVLFEIVILVTINIHLGKL